MLGNFSLWKRNLLRTNVKLDFLIHYHKPPGQCASLVSITCMKTRKNVENNVFIKYIKESAWPTQIFYSQLFLVIYLHHNNALTSGVEIYVYESANCAPKLAVCTPNLSLECKLCTQLLKVCSTFCLILQQKASSACMIKAFFGLVVISIVSYNNFWKELGFDD